MKIDSLEGRREEMLDEISRFTPRQYEVTRMLARGYSYKEIADELGISPHTVNTHVKTILRRLKLSGSRRLATLMIHLDAERRIVADTVVKAARESTLPPA